ncbi:neutral zinc metallopeptidase [Tessaracoccus sp. OS52]|uniref:neutral zinc metallopeptidase n=1 Tax=Tessaracoccus sp. OS52 TaxID=2886691 RepID=UPI001D1109E1|nr:neutral zinc metallopeptidase [Tessaracoccus sp. OS52]MCC2592226.1 neutral zinc metallopeptidase [Tessaracoccus sp. OS52]
MRVQQSVLYTARFPVQQGCPPPGLIETMQELESYTTAQLGCVQKAWKPVLQALDLPTHDVPHYYYGQSVTSPCGTTSAPAYYCSAGGGAIYFGERLLDDTRRDPLWAKDLVGHEYGHHLQAVNGFFEAIYELPGGNEVIRRNEIQATCLAFGMIRKDRSYALEEEFFSRLEPHLRSYLDDGIHGSKDSLAYWGMRGFYADHAAECNTWVVGPEWVE